MNNTDSRIIGLYFMRDENAIRESEKKYGKYCAKIAIDILKDADDADECLANTWLTAWNTIPPEKPLKLGAFLARIARNKALDMYSFKRAKKRSVKMEAILDEFSDCAPEGDADFVEEIAFREVFNDFLSKLEKDTRIIFLRRYFYGLSIREIARGMKMSESNVKVSLHRTRQKLRIKLQTEGIMI